VYSVGQVVEIAQVISGVIAFRGIYCRNLPVFSLIPGADGEFACAKYAGMPLSNWGAARLPHLGREGTTAHGVGSDEGTGQSDN
jgi:hypothetical protein